MRQEENLHAALTNYIKHQYPKLIFNTDLSGIKLTMGQAIKVRALRSSRAFPDIVIYEPRKGFHALFIELKAEGVTIYKKDGQLVANEHIREQAKMLEILSKKGYCAHFACGFIEAQKLIKWYLES